MDYLDTLESEAIYIIREVAGQFQNPAILFSGGKDSACLVRLAQKAFLPTKIPFQLLHVDTGHNFPEVIEFRNQTARSLDARLVVAKVETTIQQGKARQPDPSNPSRNAIQSITLLDAIQEFKFDALIGGARREEEKARAKERVFSIRDEFGQWDPRNQRPELWQLYNGRLQPGQHMRVFPLSNWTELDIWRYIEREKIELPTLYYTHPRKCIRKPNGTLMAHCEFLAPGPGDEVYDLQVRCRTVGDITCTGLIESRASTIQEIIGEVILAKTTERGSRLDDKVSETAMEDRKKRGYF